ncbi:MAG: hypothetical protein IJ009_04360 [Clostridia bacterium]|nr:hypothetical protein [Clostridia bacterium]
MNAKKILSIVLALVCLAVPVTMTACGGSTGPVPVVCGETGMTEQCGVATYGVDYYSLGVKAGDMAADILLDGANVSTMPVQTDPNPSLYVNPELAEEIGFTIPQAILDRAEGGAAPQVTRTDAIVESGADFTVGILQLVQHVALDQSNKGFQDQLSVRMKAAGKTVQVLDRNASGEDSNNITIAETFVNQNVDLIYTIATSSSVAAANATRENKIPVLFCAVTNPVGEGLVASMDAPGANVSGVSDINPVAKQIELAGELLGKDDVKIGFLYSSGETNSIFQVDLGKAACEDLGYTYEVRGISDINDLESAFVALKNAGVDLVYVPTDNALANGAANIHTVNKG